jgi:hypothetical protein
MAKMKLSHLLAKVPAAEVNITNISFELHDLLGWAIVECELVLGGGNSETGITLTIPVQVSTKEVAEWFDVVKVLGNSRRKIRK